MMKIMKIYKRRILADDVLKRTLRRRSREEQGGFDSQQTK